VGLPCNYLGSLLDGSEENVCEGQNKSREKNKGETRLAGVLRVGQYKLI